MTLLDFFVIGAPKPGTTALQAVVSGHTLGESGPKGLGRPKHIGSETVLTPVRRMNELLGFPNPVNETSARVVAGGVVAMTTATIVFDQSWILLPLTYGFAARLLTGPKLSPLAQLATKVVTPRLAVEHRFSAGPPKRLAQGMGLALSGTALVLHYGFGRKRTAKGVLAVLATAAGLEAFFGLCLACRMFPMLIKLGLVPEETCEKCANIWAGSETSEVAEEGLV